MFTASIQHEYENCIFLTPKLFNKLLSEKVIKRLWTKSSNGKSKGKIWKITQLMKD